MEIPTSLTRRRFLQIGATLTAVGALGLSGQSAAALVSPAPALRLNKFTVLRRFMKGRLLMPNDDVYLMAAFPNNARWAHVLPAAIAMCADAEDVRKCIEWALAYGERFAIRSGGHSYAGFSTTTGLLIDVKAMNKVAFDLDRQIAIVQAGASNQNVANALNMTPFAIPSGRCPTVGVSGLVLGGGWGFSATHAGLTCDSLLETDIVLASAKQVTAKPESCTEDLFWALRGGGGGNFGVNTSFTFQLHKVDKVTVFNILWPGQQQVEMLRRLQEIQLTHSTKISTRTKAYPDKPGPRPKMEQLQVTTLGIFWGDENQTREALAPALDLVPPLSADIRTMSYWQARDYLITDDPTGMYDLRSSYVAEALSEEGLETMLKWMTKWPGGSLLPENMGILFAIGGEARKIQPDATAYVHRNANYIFEMEAAWAPIDLPEIVRAQKRWLTDYFEAMQKYLLPQSYVNFPNRELKDWKKAYYGSNLERLSVIKGKYDPLNLFKFEQSIPRKFERSMQRCS